MVKKQHIFNNQLQFIDWFYEYTNKIKGKVQVYFQDEIGKRKYKNKIYTLNIKNKQSVKS